MIPSVPGHPVPLLLGPQLLKIIHAQLINTTKTITFFIKNFLLNVFINSQIYTLKCNLNNV